MESARGIVLWLFVINLGIAFGAGLYEARVVIPEWASLPPRVWPNTGLLFWVYVTTVPLTLLVIANGFAWLRSDRPSNWYLAAMIFAVVERIATFAYFIPAMVRLMSSDAAPQSEITEALSQWLLMNYGRHALVFSAWFSSLKALVSLR